MSYDREEAVKYAITWALGRNPDFYNYDKIGGDCTNFISQCLYAGTRQMNYRKNGWYYNYANDKSPSWTGVEFLYKFLIANEYEGPKGRLIDIGEIEVGDLIQLSFNGVIFGHSLIVSKKNGNDIFVCAHSIDAINRLLSDYDYQKMRCINIF